MGQFTPITIEGHINQAVASLLRKVLEQGVASAVLVPCRQPHQKTVMQTLVSDPQHLDKADPFAPVVPTNSARLVAALTHENEAPVAAVLRSCEVRAFLELVKLNQGAVENLLLIGIDCPRPLRDPRLLGACGSGRRPDHDLLEGQHQWWRHEVCVGQRRGDIVPDL